MHALFITYELRDASPAQHAELRRQLALAVATVPGLVSETWLANSETGRYGGFYVFTSRTTLGEFARALLAELSSLGSIPGLTAAEFSVAEIPTAVTRGPSALRKEVD